jgi:hypothetical protein
MQEKQSQNEYPPIKSGEIFDPGKEILEILKEPREKRPQKLAEFKEKLQYQQKGLAKIQTDIIEKIRENPEASFRELYEETCRLGTEYGMNEEQQKIAYAALEKYENCHRAVQDEYESFLEGSLIYHDLFGKEPKGEIEIITGPAILYVKCHELGDYEYAFWKGRQEKDARLPFNDEIKKKADISKGFELSGFSSHPDLYVAVENVTQTLREPDPENFSKEVFLHEEQHAIKSLFDEPFEKDKAFANRSMERFKAAKSQEDKKRILKSYFRATRKEAEIYAKDEMLAYYKDGTAFPEIMKKLAKKYDFLKKEKENEFRPLWMNNNEPDRALSEETSEEVYIKEYRRLLKTAMRAIKKMEEAGYDKEEITAFLTHEPLAKWEKAVKRVLENS